MTALPTLEWDQSQLVQMDQRLRRWAASALMAAQGWAVQLQAWVLRLTSLIGISWDANTLCGYG